MELLKFVEIAYHLHSVLAAAVPLVTSMSSYTPTGSKMFELSFLHEYWTNNFQTFLYQVKHEGQDKKIF